MKKLTAPGSVLIVSQPRFSKRGRHDSWPSHATEYIDFTFVKAYSHTCYAMVSFKLKNLRVFNYFITPGGTDAQLSQLTNEWYDYTTPDGVHGAFGEWYNLVLRADFNDKSPVEDIDYWLHNH